MNFLHSFYECLIAISFILPKHLWKTMKEAAIEASGCILGCSGKKYLTCLYKLWLRGVWSTPLDIHQGWRNSILRCEFPVPSLTLLFLFLISSAPSIYSLLLKLFSLVPCLTWFEFMLCITRWNRKYDLTIIAGMVFEVTGVCITINFKRGSLVSKITPLAQTQNLKTKSCERRACV